MYVITVTFRVRHGHQQQFHKAVLNQAQRSLKREIGCHVFDVCTDPTDDCRVFLFEKYTDESAFQAHLQSEHLKQFNREISQMVQSKDVLVWSQKGKSR